jgi:hypothetical protein
MTDGAALVIQPGTNTIRVSFDSLPLTRGVYAISVVVAEREINNQVLALLNHWEFEVHVARGDLGAGVLHVRPSWDCPAALGVVSGRRTNLGG